MNKPKKKYSFPIIISLLITVGIFSSCENDIEEVNSINNDELFPDQELRDVDVLYSNNGRVKFRMKAPFVEQFGGEKHFNEMPEGVEVEIFDSAMNVTTRLTSNYAIDLAHEKKMEAKDDVVVINDKGEKLNTEHLIWDMQSEKIESDVFVKITTPQQVLMGEGLISNQDFTDYKILKPRGVINIQDAEGY